jgi:putative transposase
LPATAPNKVWACDFVFDACANGQRPKCLTVIDDLSRESLAIDVAGSTRSKRVIGAWRRHYNHVRPHQSLKDRTPVEFAALYHSIHRSAVLQS